MPIESPPAPSKLQPAVETPRPHWIVDIALRAKLANSELLSVPVRASTEEAWAKALLSFSKDAA